jgi:hypothetical protein
MKGFSERMMKRGGRVMQKAEEERLRNTHAL